MQTSGANMILLDGVSSSGKTTICKFYEEQGYHRIAFDDFHSGAKKASIADLPNEYIGKNRKRELAMLKLHELLLAESKKYRLVIIDDITQGIRKFIPNICIIIMYTPIADLVRNMLNRKTVEPRNIHVFEQFATKYIKAIPCNKIIDYVNRLEFVTFLEKLKYEFESERELEDFAKKIFADMNIYDDNDHPISLRDNHEYYYIINTHNKTPREIYDEIKEQTDQYNPNNNLVYVFHKFQ
jgi:broad-specificity NMP kinase